MSCSIKEGSGRGNQLFFASILYLESLQQHIQPKLLLMTNSNLHMNIRLTPRVHDRWPWTAVRSNFVKILCDFGRQQLL